MILGVVDTLQDLLNNIKIFIENIFGILPAEISVVAVSVFAILLALYIYRLLR